MSYTRRDGALTRAAALMVKGEDVIVRSSSVNGDCLTCDPGRRHAAAPLRVRRAEPPVRAVRLDRVQLPITRAGLGRLPRERDVPPVRRPRRLDRRAGQTQV